MVFILGGFYTYCCYRRVFYTMMPVPSWEVFEECPQCCSPAGKSCYNLRSTSKKLRLSKNPHKGRKMKKE